MSENEHLSLIAEEVKKLYPDISFNSAMVTSYDSPNSNIPPHSDDEECIVPGSTILTVSLGGGRKVVFRRKPPGQYRREELTVNNGEVYTMTRSSQDHWDHCIPKVCAEEFTGQRLGVTFRLLKQTRRTSSDNNVSSRTDSPHPQ